MTNIFSYLYKFDCRKRLYVWLWSKKEKDSAQKIPFTFWGNPLWIFCHWAAFLPISPLIRRAQEERGFAVRQYGALWRNTAPSIGPGIGRGSFRGALLGLRSRGQISEIFRNTSASIGHCCHILAHPQTVSSVSFPVHPDPQTSPPRPWHTWSPPQPVFQNASRISSSHVRSQHQHSCLPGCRSVQSGLRFSALVLTPPHFPHNGQVLFKSVIRGVPGWLSR